MFDFITISNGVAVVQHRSSGRVYRFRPLHRGNWSALILDRVDDAPPPGGRSDDLSDAARTFAETATSIVFGAVPERPPADATKDAPGHHQPVA